MKTLAMAVSALVLILPAFAERDQDSKAEKSGDAKKPVYNEKADAKADIEAALAAAKRENRRVLIQWGGNWCPWCIRLHERFKSDSALARTLLYEYQVVLVDIGRFNKNMDLARKYSADLKKHGVPYLTVLDGNGKVLANQATDPFETKDGGKAGHDAKKVQEFLKSHQATPLKANDVLAAALATAEKDGRNVFVHFSAPWCGWCRRLDAWLHRPDIAPVFNKDFVDVKIDIDRMDGGKAVLARYNKSKGGGIPWFAMLDATGKTIITSDGPKGNIGFPVDDHEIVHFVKMLEASKRRITNQEIEEFRKSLTPPAKDKKGAF